MKNGTHWESKGTPKSVHFVVFSRLLPRKPQKLPKWMLNELKMDLKWRQNGIKMESKWNPRAAVIAVAAMTAARISNRLKHKLQTGCKVHRSFRPRAGSGLTRPGPLAQRICWGFNFKLQSSRFKPAKKSLKK